MTYEKYILKTNKLLYRYMYAYTHKHIYIYMRDRDIDGSGNYDALKSWLKIYILQL